MTSICAANVYHFWHDRKKCCVLSRLLGAPTASPSRAAPRRATPRRAGAREIGAPADLTVVASRRQEESERARSVRFLIIRLFPERGETSSLSRYLACSPLLITFPLLILVVLLFGSFVFVLAQFSFLSRRVPFSSSEVAEWKCHRHRRARFSSF
jgi:hypothetical protein